MVIALPLVAAFLLGVGFVLQQRAASRAPQADVLKLRLLWDLAHSRQWLGGMASMVCGQIVSAIALGQASISIVEPLLATNLLIALVLSSAVTRSPLRRTDWLGCLVLGSGLAAFLAAGARSPGFAPSRACSSRSGGDSRSCRRAHSWPVPPGVLPGCRTA